MLHELFPTLRQNTKIRNYFADNISTDIKFSKTELPKIIQSGEFLGALLGKFAGLLTKVAVLLAKNVLVPLGTMASASAIDGAIQRKMCGRGAGKGVTLVISNKNMDDIT